MAARIQTRLAQLEAALRFARDQYDYGKSDEDGDAAIAKVNAFLRLREIEQQPDESLMLALARALEISPAALSQQIAAEIDPIHKYLEDTGVFEEIEKMKRAGTWSVH